MSDEEQTPEEVVIGSDADLAKWSEPAGNGRTRLRLEYPVGTEERPIEEMLIARTKAKHLRKIKGDPTVGQILDMAADLTGLSQGHIDALDGATDMVRLISIVGRDFSGGPRGISAQR